MPLVSHRELPTYDRLRQEGHHILTPERADSQDIRALHIGLLNMMPDAALAATERQFFRLISSSNTISQFYVHPFTFPQIERGEHARAHIDQYYEPLEQVQEQGLDALIISGANITQPNLAEEVFWDPLKDLVDWAEQHVTSTLCSCLASHAVFQFRYGLHRRGLNEKMWGVFPHRVTDPTHPLVSDTNSRFDVPHSRFNEVTPEQCRSAGLHVLVEGETPGVQLAVSPDGFRMVFFQGHPEYDKISLLKEYKREVGRYIDGESADYPPFPANYFDLRSRALLDEYRQHLENAMAAKKSPPAFPEDLLTDQIENTWHDSGEAVVGNWIGQVYQLTNTVRHIPHMEGIDPENPLKWLDSSYA